MGTTTKYSPRYYGTWSEQKKRGRLARIVSAVLAISAGAAFLIWSAATQ